jgi:hypothetical protein
MDKDERAALKALYPEHYFMRCIALGHQCIVALPRKQSTPEKEAAVELWHGASVRIGDTGPVTNG